MSCTSLVFRALVAFALVAGAGCDKRPIEGPAPGAVPPVRTPVGPIPGPGVKATSAVNPHGMNEMVLEEGRKLFLRFNCAGCHGGHAGGGMGPSLRDKAWLYGNSDAEIFDSIAEGRAHGMPAWGVKLPEDQIWKMTAYIQSLRTPMEPSPPVQTLPPPPPPQ